MNLFLLNLKSFSHISFITALVLTLAMAPFSTTIACGMKAVGKMTIGSKQGAINHKQEVAKDCKKTCCKKENKNKRGCCGDPDCDGKGCGGGGCACSCSASSVATLTPGYVLEVYKDASVFKNQVIPFLETFPHKVSLHIWQPPKV